MTLNISMPQQFFRKGMAGPSTYSSSTLPNGQSSVDVNCGDLTKDDVVHIFETGTSASQPGPLIEKKYVAGVLQRTTGKNGIFKVALVDGSTAGADVTFDWAVLSSKAL